jgi:AcrR family transcriptional regulator
LTGFVNMLDCVGQKKVTGGAEMPRERTRSNDPEGVRRRILDVASAAFQARGYHATSTHDIMRAAEVTGGALHHHFPTKKALALAVIRDRVAPALQDTWIEPIRTASTVVDGILEVFASVAASVEERGSVLGCPLNNLAAELSLADPDFQAAFSQIFEVWRKAISERARAEKVGITTLRAPDDLGTFVVATYSGAIGMAKARQSSEPLRACARQLAAVLGPRRGAPHKGRGPRGITSE